MKRTDKKVHIGSVHKYMRRFFAAVMVCVMTLSSSGVTIMLNAVDIMADGEGGTATEKSFLSVDNFEDFGVNDEQDTKTIDGNKVYNTSYGLHTDKTVTKAYSDGRTFDVDLDSWYIGENPADVGMVLDASGSMAWTTDALNPIDLDDHTKELEMSVDDFKNNLTYVDADGYLTKAGVDKILNKNKTDNNRLSYNNYQYYVYENRSTVDEFVPIGYWGGKKIQPIAIYPFKNSLDNTVDKDANTKAIPIKDINKNEGEKFDLTSLSGLSKEAKAINYKTSDPATLDIKGLASDGGALLFNETPTSNSFSVMSRLTFYIDDKDKETPLFYIGKLDGTNYCEVTRKGDNFYAYTLKDGKSEKITWSRSFVNKNTTNTDWINFHIVFDDGILKFYCYDVRNNSTKFFSNNTNKLVFDGTVDPNDIKIIIGGDIQDLGGSGFAQIDNTATVLLDAALTSTQAQKLTDKNFINGDDDNKGEVKDSDGLNEKVITRLRFGSAKEEGVNEKEEAFYKIIDNAKENLEGKNIFDDSNVHVITTTDDDYVSYGSDGGLNITELIKSKYAVLLQDIPNDIYTITFEILSNSNANTSDVANVMYVGSEDSSDKKKLL